jgi:hypothetical protein
MVTTTATAMAERTRTLPDAVGSTRRLSGQIRTRGVILLAGIVALAVTLQVSVAGVFRSARPQLALTLAPYDAQARSKLAWQLAGYGDTETDARALALDAIRRDPVQPAALRVLAQTLDANDAATQRTELALMAQAQRLSRRDQQTQIWFINHVGQQGDVEAMVRHIDIALRTSETSRSALFPMLVAAAADPQGAQIIDRTLAKKPNWAVPFGAFAIGWGSDLDVATRMARLLFDPRKPDDRDRYLTLLGRLVAAGRYSQAWVLYSDPALGLHGGNAGHLRHGDFETAEDETPFDWSYSDDGELFGARERLPERNGFVLRVAASNGRSGEVARQYLHLPAGIHRLRAIAGDVPAKIPERPVIRIECVDPAGGRPLVSVRPAAAGTAARELQASFAVPANCAFQKIGITIAGEDAFGETSPWLDDIRIE